MAHSSSQKDMDRVKGWWADMSPAGYQLVDCDTCRLLFVTLNQNIIVEYCYSMIDEPWCIFCNVGHYSGWVGVHEEASRWSVSKAYIHTMSAFMTYWTRFLFGRFFFYFIYHISTVLAPLQDLSFIHFHRSNGPPPFFIVLSVTKRYTHKNTYTHKGNPFVCM